ncbi:MAG: Ldh family oxidoreductase [Bacteroidetes bacterium]|nr:MAG: Ldh family oxidoreductase [Bacteroidota bacterium]
MTNSISVLELKKLIITILNKEGVPVDQSEIIADSIIYAHLSGKGTHGVIRIPIYIKKIQKGIMEADTKLSTMQSKGVVEICSANHGFGQVAAYYGMKRAIKKAKDLGVGIVSIRNSNNFGVAAYFCQQAVDEGMIGVLYSNSAPAIAPWGGKKPLFGTNPMAYGFPSPEGLPPIVFDMAVSSAARGKIRLAAKYGEKIPFGWALDREGNPTNDPDLALNGSMIPIGEYKGAGLAMIVDYFAGLLSGAGFAGNVKPLNIDSGFSDNGHFIMAMNPEFFMLADEYEERFNAFLKSIIEAGPDVRIPGENVYKTRLEKKQSIALSAKVYTEFMALKKRYSVV